MSWDRGKLPKIPDFDDLRKVERPSRKPDFTWHSCVYWWDEMLMGRTTSNYRIETCVLATCPLTGLLMYWDGYSYLKWTIVTDNEPNWSYREWVDMQCDKHFTS